MRPIELTEDHKAKLIVMCEFLFTEYVEITIHEREEDEDYNIITFYTKKDLNGCSYFEIHWFEFCSRFITSKLDDFYFKEIINPVDPYSIENSGKNMKYPNNWQELWQRRPFLGFNSNLNGTHYKEHPVNYLYNEFLKLKIRETKTILP